MCITAHTVHNNMCITAVYDNMCIISCILLMDCTYYHHNYYLLYTLNAPAISDGGSDSSESDGPPMHMMDKVGKKVIYNFATCTCIHVTTLHVLYVLYV